jgi:hypothetical protein
MSDSNAMSRFALRVAELVQRTRYVVAQTQDEKEAIYRNRYEANLRERTIGPNETRMLIDKHDDTPNCFNVGLFLDGRLAAALRMHLLWRDYPYSTLIEVYPEVIAPMVEAGRKIIDITRLVADFDIARKEPALPYAAVRLSMMIAAHFEADTILAAARQEHIPFYKREFFAAQRTPPREYPTIVKPVALFEIDYARDRDAIIARHPFYASTAAEREALFGPAIWPALAAHQQFA